MSSRWNEIVNWLIIAWILLVGVCYAVACYQAPEEVKFLLRG